jgi:hypothetical protein
MRRPLISPVISIVILVIAGALGIGYFKVIVIPRREVARFRQAMAPSQILGRTPEQVISIFGKPDSDTRFTPDSTFPKNQSYMTYEGPCWDYCVIQFVNDKAATVSQQGK